MLDTREERINSRVCVGEALLDYLVCIMDDLADVSTTVSVRLLINL